MADKKMKKYNVVKFDRYAEDEQRRECSLLECEGKHYIINQIPDWIEPCVWIANECDTSGWIIKGGNEIRLSDDINECNYDNDGRLLYLVEEKQ